MCAHEYEREHECECVACVFVIECVRVCVSGPYVPTDEAIHVDKVIVVYKHTHQK